MNRHALTKYKAACASNDEPQGLGAAANPVAEGFRSPEVASVGTRSNLEETPIQHRRKRAPLVRHADAGPASTPAKITGPVLSGIYERHRLFEALDDARTRTVTWISAPAGAGKTALVASYLQARQLPTLWYQVDASDADMASFFYYLALAADQVMPRHAEPLPLLTSEYVFGLAAFTRNYFRKLFSRLKGLAVLVLDNCQDVATDSAFHETIAHACAEIPAGINVILLSRTDPPASLARLQMSGNVALMRWNDLQLTEEECVGIAELRQKTRQLTHAAVQSLHKLTDGWAAGLILMLEQTSAASHLMPIDKLCDRSVIFDYFANEIFRHTALSTQDFLLSTAFLPKISVPVAQQLAPDTDAARVLGDLARRNYFTVQLDDEHGSYEYHPLFQAFLTSHAAHAYTAQKIRQLKQHSAQLLADSGDAESAVSLLQQAEDWQAATRLILEQAKTLAAQGRTQTLAAWLQKLPLAERNENPWALYWLGICRLSFSPAEARGYFEKSFALFEQQDDSSPLHLAWSGIMDSYVVEWNDFTSMDKWLDAYHSLTQGRKPPSREIETASLFSYLAGLSHRRFDDPDLALIADRAQAVFLDEMDNNRRFTQGAPLILYYTWKGEVAKAEYLLHTLSAQPSDTHVHPLARINWYGFKVLATWMTGAPEEGLRTANDSLALAEQSGVHIFDNITFGDSIYIYLQIGDVAMARERANRMARCVTGRAQLFDAYYHHLSSMVSLHEGDIARALQEGRRAVQLSRSSGALFWEAISLLTSAYACAKHGDTGRALTEIEEARAIGDRVQSKMIIHSCAFTEAAVRRMRGELEYMLQALGCALTVGKETGLMAPSPWCLREEAAILYATALEAGVQADYVKTVIAKTRLPVPVGHLPEYWPWPIRIYTLGRFAVVKDDQPLTFNGKAQKKPLDLLKVIIALGGRNIDAVVLINILWPSPDADSKNLFDNTLHRLRKLLGRDDAITVQEGKLTLNPQVVWADVWAFERMAEYSQKICRQAAACTGTADHAVQKAFRLYQGHFLALETEQPWVLPLRERLRSKFSRYVTTLGQHWEHAGAWSQAIEVYQRGTELDHLSEDMYRHLMRSHLQLGNHAEALGVYRRCREMLSIVLGVKPCAETEALLVQIRKNLV